MNQKILFIFSIIYTSFTSTQAQAQAQYNNFGFLGFSSVYGQSVFSAHNEQNLSVEPSLFYNSKNGFIDGSLANIALLPYLGLTGQWRFSEHSDVMPLGINDRNENGELGISIGTVGARLTYLHDVTNIHRGYEIQLHLGRTLNIPIENFTLTPYLEIDYRDKNLSQHLYSITYQEALNSTLTEFSANSTWVYQTGIIGIYSFTPAWLVLTKLELEHHDSDSPLIQRDLGWSFSLGIVYKFTN